MVVESLGGVRFCDDACKMRAIRAIVAKKVRESLHMRLCRPDPALTLGEFAIIRIHCSASNEIMACQNADDCIK